MNGVSVRVRLVKTISELCYISSHVKSRVVPATHSLDLSVFF